MSSEAVARIQAQLQSESSGSQGLRWQLPDSFTESDWAELLPGAIARLKAGPNELAIDVITEVCFSYLALLPPYLEELFHTPHYFTTVHSYIPWRIAGKEHINYLQRGLALPELRQHAIGALLELRVPEAFALLPQELEEQRFANVGFVREAGELRQCYSTHIYHLHFLPEYVEKWQEWETRPETYGDVSEYPYSFGGSVASQFCPCCGDTLHQLLTFPTADLVPDICSLPSVTLATCNHCLGWQEKASPLFLRHDDAGIPQSIAPEEPVSSELRCAPFEETVVALTPVPEAFRWQEWTFQQNIHRLGGHPAWVQLAEYPQCPKCDATMPFLLQLNSRLPFLWPNPEELEVMEWGSGGVAYFFWCDDCRISAGNWQCT